MLEIALREKSKKIKNIKYQCENTIRLYFSPKSLLNTAIKNNKIKKIYLKISDTSLIIIYKIINNIRYNINNINYEIINLYCCFNPYLYSKFIFNIL